MTSAKIFYPLPVEGDIVWCRFPNSEAIGKPGPKSRPALVVAISDKDHAVEVVYGTSQKTHQLYPSEFVIDPSDQGYEVSGLSYRTKFDFKKRVKLLFNADWFDPAPDSTGNSPLPKLGVLHSRYYKDAAAAAARA